MCESFCLLTNSLSLTWWVCHIQSRLIGFFTVCGVRLNHQNHLSLPIAWLATALHSQLPPQRKVKTSFSFSSTLRVVQLIFHYVQLCFKQWGQILFNNGYVSVESWNTASISFSAPYFILLQSLSAACYSRLNLKEGDDVMPEPNWKWFDFFLQLWKRNERDIQFYHKSRFTVSL